VWLLLIKSSFKREEREMKAITNIGIVVCIVAMAVIFEASHPGFYTSKFNNEKEELIITNELLGQPAEMAVQLLGKPNRVVENENGSVIVEYFPYSFMSFSRFQLKVVEGKLEKVRKFVF
jgi:hypothetical protein